MSGLLRPPPTAGGGNGFGLFPDPDARLFDSRFSSVRQDSPVTWLPFDPNRGFEISSAVRKVQWLHRFITELALDWALQAPDHWSRKALDIIRPIVFPLTSGGTLISDRSVGLHQSTTGIDVDMLQIMDVTVFKTRVPLNFGD